MIVVGGAAKPVAAKSLKWQTLHGSWAKRLALRTLAFAIAISLLPLMHVVLDIDPTKPLLSSDSCDSEMGFFGPDSLLGQVLKPVAPAIFPHVGSGLCKYNVNLTIGVVRELMGKSLLSCDANALCVGQGSAVAAFALGEMGFSDVAVIHKHPFFSFKQKQVLCELEFDDNSFGFVFARDLKMVSVPALLVNEIERVLKPGGVAAVLVGIEGSSHDSLIRAATSVSSFIKGSDVVHVVSLGTFALVAFKKKANKLDSFENYLLPKNCPSVSRNKPFVNNMEPLVEKKTNNHGSKIVYLPSYVDVPTKGKLVYVDMGVKEAANFSDSNWFLPSYPIDSRLFNVYIVDHDALVLSSHVKNPGVTFIYHPALSPTVGKDEIGNVSDQEPLVGEEEFDFFVWFKETVEFADFVVLKMNVGKPEMKFLSDLFRSGIICYVDELFLHCPEYAHNGEGCINIFKSLRNVGVFVHQWLGN